jgi:hypothetical protein
MDLHIKAHTPFGDEDYDFAVEAGKPARVSFRGNTVEIHEYLLFDNEFYAKFSTDVPITTSVVLCIKYNEDMSEQNCYATIGEYASIPLTVSKA